MERQTGLVNDRLIYTLDWTLSQSAFRDLVRDLIHQAEKKHKVLALPMQIQPGKTFIDYLTLLLAQLDCQGCDAPCCRENPDGKLTHLIAPEYERLAKKYGKELFIVKDGKAFLPTPCPFLRKNRPPRHGDLCSIYPDRPLVCVLYPFQPGGTDVKGEDVLSLASSCPSARRLAKDIYMAAWQIRHQYRLLGDKDFWKGFI